MCSPYLCVCVAQQRDEWSVDMAGASLRARGQPEERLVVRVVLGHKCAPVDRVLFLVNGTGVRGLRGFHEIYYEICLCPSAREIS